MVRRSGTALVENTDVAQGCQTHRSDARARPGAGWARPNHMDRQHSQQGARCMQHRRGVSVARRRRRVGAPPSSAQRNRRLSSALLFSKAAAWKLPGHERDASGRRLSASRRLPTIIVEERRRSPMNRKSVSNMPTVDTQAAAAAGCSAIASQLRRALTRTQMGTETHASSAFSCHSRGDA